jgi:hypothetical protein
MNYAAEMGSGTMIRIPNFVTMGLAIQMLIEGGYTYSHTVLHKISLFKRQLKQTKCKSGNVHSVYFAISSVLPTSFVM